MMYIKTKKKYTVSPTFGALSSLVDDMTVPQHFFLNHGTSQMEQVFP